MNRVSLAFASIPMALACVVAAGGCFDDASPAPSGGPNNTECVSVGTCSEPNIPLGCALGVAPCVDGVRGCPVVVCSDASAPEPSPDAATSEPSADGACASVGICNEPNIPPGCALGAAPCINGVSECPPVICPDASAPDAAAIDASLDAAAFDAALDAVAVAAPDAGGFICDSGNGSPISCDGQTQACKIVNGGAYPGIHAPSCVAIPTNCASAPTCSCLQSALGSGIMCSMDASGDFTLTQDVP